MSRLALGYVYGRVKLYSAQYAAYSRSVPERYPLRPAHGEVPYDFNGKSWFSERSRLDGTTFGSAFIAEF